MLTRQEFRLASRTLAHRRGCVFSQWTLTSRLPPCRPVRSPLTGRLAGHVAQFLCYGGSWKRLVVFLRGSYSGETEVTSKQKTSQALAFLSDTLRNKESCANRLEKIISEPKWTFHCKVWKDPINTLLSIIRNFTFFHLWYWARVGTVTKQKEACAYFCHCTLQIYLG